jgi:hypothetical protein
MADEVPIPPEALADPKAFEVFRVWYAQNSMYMGLNKRADDPELWGVILAAAAQQGATFCGDNEPSDALRIIQTMFNAEVDASALLRLSSTN